MKRHRSICLLAALLAAATLSGCSQKRNQVTQDAQQHWDQVRGRMKYQLARQQYDAGRPEEAARTVQEAIAMDPEFPPGYVLMTRCCLETGDLKAASATLATARDRQLQSAGLAYLQGVLSELEHDHDTALAAFQAARKLDPAQVDFIVAEAECLVAMDRAEQALQVLEAYRETDDANGTLDSLRARIAVLSGDIEMADPAYRTAVRKSDDPWLTFDYSVFLLQRGRLEEARSLLEPLVVRLPEGFPEGPVVRALARCRLALGDVIPAVRELGEYLRKSPEDTEAQLLMATASVAGRKHSLALRACHVVLQQDPENTEALMLETIVHLRESRLQAADETLSHVLRINPKDEVARQTYAAVQRRIRPDRTAEIPASIHEAVAVEEEVIGGTR